MTTQTKFNNFKPSRAEFQIYICSIRAYNNSRHDGFWLPIEWGDEEDELKQKISEWLKEKESVRGEEWRVDDTQGFPSFLDSATNLSDFIKYIDILNEIDVSNGEALDIYLENIYHNTLNATTTKEEIVENFEAALIGCFDTKRDFIEQYLENNFSETIKDLPNIFKHNINYEGVWIDLENNGDIWSERGVSGLHVFFNL
jgi:antirestriction protein